MSLPGIEVGRPPTPTAKHKAEGTYRGERHDQRGDEPTYPNTSMKPPKVLNKLAKEEWRRLAPELTKRGLLTMADRAVFTVYCQAWADFHDLTEQVNGLSSITFTTANGYEGVSPLIGARTKAWAMMKEAATRFGLDPASRTRLHVPTGGTAKDDEDFLFGTPKLEP